MEGNQNIWSPAGKISPRIKRLRDEFFSFRERDYFRNEVLPFTSGTPWDNVWSPHNWGVVPELYLFFASYQDSLLSLAKEVELPPKFWAQPLVVRRATFFKRVLEEYLPVKILEGELIVGSYFNTALSRAHTQREAKRWKKDEKKWLKQARLINDLGIGNCGAVPGHIIPDYPRVLRIGFKGIKEKLVEENLGETKDLSRKQFLKALIICSEAVKSFAERYAREAKRLAGDSSDLRRKKELEEISKVCARVPWEPASTFQEALQALWFTHSLVMADESFPGAGLSYGRFDQYIYPYYQQDIQAGGLNRQSAKEILQSFWIKHNYAYDYQGRVGTNQGINSGFGQLITLSGRGPQGEDLTNELTWLTLEVIEEMNLLEPKPNIRLHKRTPSDFLMRVCQLVATTQGAPFLLNFDETSIRGLRWQGLPEEELWDYAPVGCLENTLQGCDRSGTVDVNLNLAKPIELVFTRGKDLKTGKQIGVVTPDPLRFRSFDQFMLAYKEHLKKTIEVIIDCENLADSIRSRFEPNPYLSTLVNGCAESGKDVTAGGARYNFITVEGVAFATAVDSLSAVKKLVFEEKKIEMGRLIQAIWSNFEKDERLRQLLLNKAPKYGNDLDYVDSIAREVSTYWTNEVFRQTSPSTGRRYRGGYLSWNYWISYAASTAATPDGRKCGAYLSNGIGAVNGMEREGPTAMARSVGKISLETAPNGASHTMSLSPSLVRDKEHREKLSAFLRAYGEKGGTSLQINIIDQDTLRKAQRNPDEYRNLLVRVTGYNAYFVMLGREIQDEIISRRSHVGGIS
ncbi:MAG: hypothetical protein COS84_07250 [Armatimonadetes bacterium CG07_land_8_20_14_0_80_40_9]|nr:MAG: hypothetical protein COS84_07250 [Armatimonadetes bacterium CG07_land_8_20_14_0_80_40_9]